MSTHRAFYRRSFLNRPRHHLGAHVIADVTVERPRKGDSYVDACLHLADCHRSIELDFTAYARREAANALRKVRILREVLVDFEAGLRAALEEVDATRGGTRQAKD